MSRDYPPIQSPAGLYEWNPKSPIDLGDVVFCQAPGWHEQNTLYRNGSIGGDENNGTLVNEHAWEFVPELGQFAIVPNGTSTYITSTKALSAGYTGSFFCWYRGKSNFLNKWIAGDSSFVTSRNGVSIWSSGLSVRLKVQDASGADSHTSSAALVAGKWTAVCCTWDGNWLRVFYDGIETGTAVAQTRQSTASLYPFRMFRDPADNTGPYYGDMSIASPMWLNPAVLSRRQIEWLSDPASRLWTIWRPKSWAATLPAESAKGYAVLNSESSVEATGYMPCSGMAVIEESAAIEAAGATVQSGFAAIAAVGSLSATGYMPCSGMAVIEASVAIEAAGLASGAIAPDSITLSASLTRGLDLAAGISTSFALAAAIRRELALELER